MSANFYSLRNMLEEGSIVDSDINNQFLAAVITSYPCLDIWVRVANDRELDVRIMYMQRNTSYVATDPWTRNNEEPKVWKQYQGAWQECKDWLISQLSELSRLNDAKRHGLHNFGGANAYDGGGMVVSNNGDGTFNVLGRFGILTVTIDNVEVPFSDFAWDFDGCEVTVTINANGGNDVVIIDRPIQNVSGTTTSFEMNPSVTLEYQVGVGGYQRGPGLVNTTPFPTSLGYAAGTNHGPPQYLSATSLPDYNFNDPAGRTGAPDPLLDSYYGAFTHQVQIPQVSDDGTVITYSGAGTAGIGQWTRVQTSYSMNATGASATTNYQGVAVLTKQVITGTWTVTKTRVGGGLFDWTWGFVSDTANTVTFGLGSAANRGDELYMHTNGSGANIDNGGMSQLTSAQSGSIGGTTVSINIPLDAATSSPGFVANGDTSQQTLVSNSNAGVILTGAAS